MLLTALVVLLFYIILPLMGAFIVKSRWRLFRHWVRQAYRAERLQYHHLQDKALQGHRYTMFGRLEAFEGRDKLWLGDGNLSVAVQFRGADVFFLDEQTKIDLDNLDTLPEPPPPPRRELWSQLGALPEGTRFVVWGTLENRNRPQFVSLKEQPLLILVYEGDSEGVLPQAIWAGRHQVEEWNFITPVSFVIGFAVLILGAYMDLRVPGARASGLSRLALALVPSTFFMPPGIFFFYWYNRLWAQSRRERGLRDLTMLRSVPSEEERLKYKKRARKGEVLAHVVFLTGAGLNALFLVLLLKNTL